MGAALLLLIISVSWVVIHLGAIVLELTGLTWEQAKFQALSAFTNAGFTTRESELVVRHPLRRKVAAYLIVLGNAGLVTTVGTFASSIMTNRVTEFLLEMVAVILGLLVLGWLSRKPKLAQRIRKSAKRRIARRYGLNVPAQELLRLDDGYILTRVKIDEKVANKTLAQLNLDFMQVLAVERQGTFLPTPRGSEYLLAGDEIIVYGARDRIKETFKAQSREHRLSIVPKF